jgi:hypothetical protein
MWQPLPIQYEFGQAEIEPVKNKSLMLRKLTKTSLGFGMAAMTLAANMSFSQVFPKSMI